jgi:hypothetical protein
MTLLEKTQALIQVERSLTMTMERVEPWLVPNTLQPSSWHAYEKRVRPIPATMDQVYQILAVARNYSSRTSAPAGWNPAAPVMGFSTPNPLPHQLRGGALAALELEQARQEERSQKRKRQEEEAEQAKAKKMAEKLLESQANTTTTSSSNNNKPSDANANANPTRPDSAKMHSSPNVRRPSRPAPQVLQTTMNLSDSGSSDEDEDSD